MDGRKSVNLIGISGRIGSGKDTFAKMIQIAICNQYRINNGGGHDLIPFDATNIKSHNFEIKKFATKLKQTVCLFTGCTLEELEDQDFKSSYLPDNWNYYIEPTNYRMTYRELLQKLGEHMRASVHPSIHINGLFSSYRHALDNYQKDLINQDKWLITDLRYSNEVNAILKRGGILIRITRSLGRDFMNQPGLHHSETSLDNYEDWDEIIENTGSLSDLYEQAKQVVEKYQLK